MAEYTQPTVICHCNCKKEPLPTEMWVGVETISCECGDASYSSSEVFSVEELAVKWKNDLPWMRKIHKTKINSAHILPREEDNV